MNENKGDENMDNTVFTVPCNKPFIVTKEEYEQMLKHARKTPMTKEEREKIIKDAEKLFKKPEKKKND